MLIMTREELRAFADVATDVTDRRTPDGLGAVSMVIRGDLSHLEFAEDGSVSVMHRTAGTRKFATVRSMLASELFGNLWNWAVNQERLLTARAASERVPGTILATAAPEPIPVTGRLEVAGHVEDRIDLARLDAHLEEQGDALLHVLVLDGPAGIGKTTHLQTLALRRARAFRTSASSTRLMLLVENRGATLQTMNQVIEASLNEIRAGVVGDQLKVLVRHGLVLLALDGFDELADPNGFQLAWAQLAHLLESLEGQGQVILSGRETLVSGARMRDAIPRLKSVQGIRMSELRLLEVPPDDAKAWLLDRGLPERIVNADRISAVLTEGSYALRPFFLSQLVRKETYLKLNESRQIDLLPILVDAMFERELEKVKVEIVQLGGRDEVRAYLQKLCEEIARDMAENEVEAIPEQTLTWLAEMWVDERLSDQVRATLIHHAARLPFLTEDDSGPIKRFAHRQFFVYFLGRDAVQSVAAGEVPKYLRRNALGPEFLEAFPQTLLTLPRDVVTGFRDEVVARLERRATYNRQAGNLGALLMVALPMVPPERPLSFADLTMDELYLWGDVPPVEFRRTTVMTLRAKKADLAGVSFEEGSYINHIDADGLSPVPSAWPRPDKPRDGAGAEGQALADEGGAGDLGLRLPDDARFGEEIVWRALRYRPFWLREDTDNDEPTARRILNDRDWPALRAHLVAHDLVRVESGYQMGGVRSDVLHFISEPMRAHFGLRVEKKQGSEG
jgi:hypothetical protein